MNDLTPPILTLQRLAHDLMYIGIDDTPLYSDNFARLNKSVLILSDALFLCKGCDLEEEANLCLALLMGYNATIYDNGDKQQKKQVILDRISTVLEKLPASLLKVRLLTYCYGEVYEESLAQDAREIINSWDSKFLTSEQIEIIEELTNIESNPYPWEEISSEA